MLKFFFLILVFLSFSVLAQPKAYLKSEDSFFPSQTVVIDGKKFKLNLMSVDSEMVKAFESNELSHKRAKEFQKYATRSNIALWGGVGLALVYLFSNKGDFSPTIYWGVFSAGFFTSIYYSSKALRAFHQSVNTYNGISDQLSFKKTYLKNVPKLSLNWKF